ncbi:formate dehydrogenase beta subunit [Halopolyspora algeriensis]|uniref:Formate dehydrogenase beta subunit n=1 Tax=Halopolyspora algeriensis TaxID=1500506 RepID=A0A368VY90_9ACTN|nr:4Fe-4S dicluster domain-containing protein [Halopolyspora algeriensis]RCW46287.1 formate dehydrogenase beta subunit [Halopolyspora algeriensis]TQM55688.1 formate dehydrogenase beta subunit [Halopolyspora algeriensis]
MTDGTYTTYERLAGPLDDPAGEAGYDGQHPPRMGFFTDTSVCIGCKACEVACKEWNLVPGDVLDMTGMSYDNTTELGANSWRHVAFIEQSVPVHEDVDLLGSLSAARSDGEGAGSPTPASTTPEEVAGTRGADLGMPGVGPPVTPGAQGALQGDREVRWLMSSDVCKHCTHAACLDVCPTGSLFRTEYGTVVVQEDICNGCGYCVPACPYGVIDQRPDDGRVFKCTLCYDRLGDGLEPACAKACPTNSIQYGQLDELRERAAERVEKLHERGITEARLYGHEPTDGVGGDGAFFLLLDEPEVYGLPPDPVVTTRDLPSMWRSAGAAAVVTAAAVAMAFVGGRR